MNYSRRNESFRYEFAEPLAGKFRLIELDGKKVQSRIGEMAIRDISPRGLKIATTLDLPVTEKKINGLFYIYIADVEYSIPGRFIWRIPKVDEIQYGIHLQGDDTMKRALLAGLKSLAKSQQPKPQAFDS